MRERESGARGSVGMSKRMCVSCESDRANLVRAGVRACVSVCVCETANAVCGSRVCASTRSARHVGSRISGASTRRHERRRSSGPRARAAGTVSVRRRVYGVVSYASLFCVRALYRAGVCERSWGRERRCPDGWLITFSLLRTYYIAHWDASRLRLGRCASAWRVPLACLAQGGLGLRDSRV